MGTGFRFGLLGPLTATWNDVPVKISASRQRAVLALLLLEAGRAVPAHRLLEEIWGVDAPESALNNLQVQVSGLRRALRAASHDDVDRSVIATEHGGYVLRIPAEALDVHDFRRLVVDGTRHLQHGAFQHAAELLRDAQRLWRATPLEELAGLPFADAARVRLCREHVGAVTLRIDAELALGHHLAVVSELRDLVADHPSDERLRGQLMLALYRSGQQIEALDVYAQARQQLADEFGIDPGPDLQVLQQRLLRQDASLLPSLPSPRTAALTERSPPERTGSALPQFTSSFVGRAAELERAGALVTGEDAPRLLSLVGPGGTGKTRLAVEVARRVSLSTGRRTVFVSLASLDHAADVLSEVMRALAVGEDPTAPLTRRLIEALQGQDLLLVLDNFEQVVAAAEDVGELVAGVPGLTVLVTSRVRLGLSGEHVFHVEPMTLPPEEDLRDPTAVLGYDAVRLFIDRANARRPIELTGEAVKAIRDICLSVDGLPLAVELAAARTGLLSPQALLPRLEQSLTLLSSGPRDLPPRQRTLRATLEWSYDLLDEDEAEVLVQLSVFAGGWNLEAADAVCPHDDLLDILARLLDKSMITAGSAGRLRMLRTVREYAGELLAADDAAPVVHERFVRWCVRRADELAVAARTGLESTVTSAARVAGFEAEVGNFTAALYAAHAAGDGESLGALTGSLAEYWFGTAQYSQPKRWVPAALELDMTPAREAYLLRVATGSSNFDADPVAAEHYGRRAITLFEQLPDAQWRVFGMRCMTGNSLRAQGRLDDAAQEFRAARSLALELDPTGLTPVTAGLYLAEVLADMGDLEEAEALLRAHVARWSVERQHDPGDAVERAYGRVGLGAVLLSRGRLSEAEELLTSVQEAVHDAPGADRVDVLLVLGGCELRRQRPDRALTLLTEALSLIRSSGYRLMLGNVLTGLGAAMARVGDTPRAAQFFGAASAHRERTGVVLTVGLLRGIADEELHRVREVLGDAFSGLHDAGAALRDAGHVLAVLEDAHHQL